jgi:hypothetical protein
MYVATIIMFFKGLLETTFLLLIFLHLVSRKLENATHGARLPIKVKENKSQHTKYKLGCLYGAATRRKRRHLLKYNGNGEKKR